MVLVGLTSSEEKQNFHSRPAKSLLRFLSAVAGCLLLHFVEMEMPVLLNVVPWYTAQRRCRAVAVGDRAWEP